MVYLIQKSRLQNLFIASILITLAFFAPYGRYLEKILIPLLSSPVSLIVYIPASLLVILYYLYLTKDFSHTRRIIYPIILIILSGIFVKITYSVAELSHLFLYGSLGGLLFLRLPNRFKFFKKIVLITLIILILGILDEGFQSCFPSRVFDPRDIVINLYAGLIGIIAVNPTIELVKKSERYVDPI